MNVVNALQAAAALAPLAASRPEFRDLAVHALAGTIGSDKLSDAARPREGANEVPTFKLVTEEGVWLTDIRLSAPDWKPGDRITRGRDTLVVVEVREGGDMPIFVVRSEERGRVEARTSR